MVGYGDDGSFRGLPIETVDDEVRYAVQQFRRLSSPMVQYSVSYDDRPGFPEKRGIIFEILPRKEITWLTPFEHSPLAYVREERQTLPATVEEMQDRLLAASSETYDSVSIGIRADDVSFRELEDYYNRKNPTKKLNDRDLVSFGLVDKKGFLTIAGYLFCDDSDYANANVCCTTWPGEDKGGKRFSDTKKYKGSILTLIKEMIEYVWSVNHYQFGGMKVGMVTEEIGSFSSASLREAVVNAVAHRDYRIIGNEIALQCYPNRIELTSPGSMRSVGFVKDGLLESVESDRRNPIICAMLARCGLMEERGSGFDLILSDYRLLDERYAPRYKSLHDSFTLVLKNKMFSYSSFVAEKESKPALFTIPRTNEFLTRGELYESNPKYKLIEDLIKRFPFAKYSDIQRETGLSLGGVKYIMIVMKEACLIRRRGSAAHGHFEVVNDIDRPAEFRSLSVEEQTKAIEWCSRYFIRTRTYNDKHTSYGLKHTLQDYDGTYLTNGQFKGAMLLCGYLPRNVEDLNWIFQISEKSPALTVKRKQSR